MSRHPGSEVHGSSGSGADCAAIVSNKWDDLALHFNAGIGRTREHTTARTASLMLYGLAASLCAAMLLTHLRRRRGASAKMPYGMPLIDGMYWLTMLIAGTLGTALGDFSSFETGLGLGGASIALSVLIVLLIAVKTARSPSIPLPYWLVVVTIRTAGTSVGDWFAHHIGLWQSTAVLAVLLTASLRAKPRGRSAVSAA